jgi:hypothetical protein
MPGIILNQKLKIYLRRRERNSFCPEAGDWGAGDGDGTTMHTHVSKCKNNKINRERKKFIWETIAYFDINFKLGDFS